MWSIGGRGASHARTPGLAARSRPPWLSVAAALLQIGLVACSASPAPDLARGASVDPTTRETLITWDASVPPSAAPSVSAPLSPTRSASAGPAGKDTGAERTTLGYYVPYDASSWEALAAHHEELDYVAVQMASVDACGNLTSSDDQTLLRSARGWGVRVLLSLFSSSGPAAHAALASDTAIDRLVDQVTDHLRAQGYDGLDLDLEGVPATDRAALTRLTTRLAEALHRQNKIFSMAVPAKTRDTTTGWAGAFDYAALGRQVDLLVVMAYAYTTASSPPGSTAPLPWVETVARFVADQVPREKALLGVPFYGYDWNTTTAGSARALRYPEADLIARGKGKSIILDDTTRSGTFTYSMNPGEVLPSLTPSSRLDHEITRRTPPVCQTATPTPSASPAPPAARPTPTSTPAVAQQHVVWLEDARTLAPRLELARRYGLGGVAAWRLGQEDPASWPVIAEWRRP